MGFVLGQHRSYPTDPPNGAVTYVRADNVTANSVTETWEDGTLTFYRTHEYNAAGEELKVSAWQLNAPHINSITGQSISGNILTFDIHGLALGNNASNLMMLFVLKNTIRWGHGPEGWKQGVVTSILSSDTQIQCIIDFTPVKGIFEPKALHLGDGDVGAFLIARTDWAEAEQDGLPPIASGKAFAASNIFDLTV